MASSVLKMCNVFQLKTEEILCDHFFPMKMKPVWEKKTCSQNNFHKCSWETVVMFFFFWTGMRGREEREIMREDEMRGKEWDDQLSAYLWLGVSPAPCWMCLIGRPVWIGSCPGRWALKAGAVLRGCWSGSLYSSVLKSSLSPLWAWARTAK